MTNFNLVSNQLKTLKLSGISQSLEEQLNKAEKKKISYLSFLTSLLSLEIDNRREKRIQRNMTGAHFPIEKTLKDFDFSNVKGITRSEINGLLDFRWLDNRNSILFFGPPGLGKSHLAICLGIEAIKTGYTVCFEKATRLIELLKLKDIQKVAGYRINRILKANLLIIDEIGYTAIEKREANLFFHLVSELYEKASIIVTSNKGVEEWTEMMGDEVMTTALLDRLLHNAKIFSLNGDSYRIQKLLKGGR